ncbi:hypothetical protein LLH00_10655 [bacterium]|nr:hypothetical protein [bacterium]
MKTTLSRLAALICALSLGLGAAARAEVRVAQNGQTLELSNRYVRLEYDLEHGTYRVGDNSGGRPVIEYAVCEVADVYGSSRSSDPGLSHAWTSEAVSDELGSGQKITVTSSSVKAPGLIWQATLYEGRTFLVLNAGLDNRTGFRVQLCQIHPLKAAAFQGCDLDSGWATLDGNGGGVRTEVRRDSTLKCWNNLLATFGAGKARRSLVIGGLTYHEFEKWAAVTKSAGSLSLDLWSQDPVGRRVDPGTRYLPDERCYVDFSTPDPFAALEQYGLALKAAQKIDPAPYDFPTLCLWYAGMPQYGGGPENNNSAGAVEEMERIRASGFQKYSRVAVRLVPDNYQTNNQQGWWDDAHWQISPNTASSMGPCYRPPYETTAKWAGAVAELGGIPLTYFQSARRSEDYCYSHPEHMLFNDPGRRLKPEERGRVFWWDDDQPPLVGYDFTDSSFIAHLRQVYANLNSGGVRGLMYDYPAESGWFPDGGFEDPYATTAVAYRNIFRFAHEGLAKPNYIHERTLSRGSDVTLGLVASQRTMGDNDEFNPAIITPSGLRWYKNRVVLSYDTDAKNPNHVFPAGRDGVRAMYTMCYVASGRLLLGLSFSRMTAEELHDLSRVFPFHTAPQSARPLDAFSGGKYPAVYDFKVNDRWRQLTLFNTKTEGGEWPSINGEEKGRGVPVANTFRVSLGAENVAGGLALDPVKNYYVYDFWNDCFVGTFRGDSCLVEDLRPGEARMLSVHEQEPNPQFISTDRHLMQGYVDFAGQPVWDAGKGELAGVAKVVGGETFNITLALNGFKPGPASADAGAGIKVTALGNGLARLSLDSARNAEVRWRVAFERK